MGETKVIRWRKYGHDRLYVKSQEGGDLGWLDLKSGRVVLQEAVEATTVHAAVVAYCRARQIDIPASVLTGVSAVPAVDVATEAEQWLAACAEAGPEPQHWDDVGLNQPGQQAAAQAELRRAAAPKRTILARLFGAHTEERSWRVGAEGERLVAAELQKLPRGWHSLHAVSVGPNNADIDHIAFGPSGVFTINAKHHPRRNVWVGGNVFMVNGQRYPYVRNARHEAQRASRLLTAATGFRVDVQAVIAVVNAGSIQVKQQPDDVRVITRRQLRRWLTRQPATLTDDGVDHILNAARKSTTWRAS